MSQTTLDRLKLMLRPAGGGVYVVSTGLSEQQALQRQLYQADDEAEIELAWHQTIERALNSESDQSKVIVLGCPSDTGAGFTRGANLAPAQLRSHLMNHHPSHPLISSHALDIGDVRVVPQLLSAEMLSSAQELATATALYGNHPLASTLPVAPLDITYNVLELILGFERSSALTPLVIGGDHSVAWPAFKAAFDRWEKSGRAKIGLLHFDAHTDLLSERLGIKYCFATWAWHANQLLGQDGRLVQVGIRASGRDRSHWEKSCGVRQYWSTEVRERGSVEVAEELISRFEALGVNALYVSNDIDGTDEAFASATGTPEPGGLRPDEVDEITRRVGERFPLIGADLVEVAPPLSRLPGEPQRTFDTAALYLKTLSELALKRKPIF